MWTKDSKNDSGKPHLDPEQLSKLQDRNKLLDILENQGQQIVVVGDTSSGKSTTINFLLGYPFNFVAQGIGTRRPCVMTLTPDPEREKVLFRTKFQKNDYTKEEDFTSLAEVANLVKNVNDPRSHPEWFDCLNADREAFRGQSMVRPDDAFDETPVYVQLFHKDIDCPMRLVDVPGLSRGNRLTTRIALSFIKPDNAVILVIGKDHPNNGGFPHLAAAMRECSRTIVVQNFANTKISDNQVTENYAALYEKMNGRNDLVLYCIDYGLPYEPGLPLWQEGYDQQDWHKINKEQGLQSVRRAMVQHTEMRAKQLQERYKDSKVFSDAIVPGLELVRKKLNDFQFHDIDGHITRLREELRRQIGKRTAELERAQIRVKQLQFPPEWDSMLASFAATVRKYLDSTHSATEMFDIGTGAVKEDESVLWTTDDEAKRAAKGAMDSHDRHDDDGLSWFSADVDRKIVNLLTEFTGFESELRIACIRSWQRLVDEFTGMLAFAPMPCVPASLHDMAKMRVGNGQSGQLNFTEETVKVVVSLGEDPKHKGLVRPLVEQLERRMRLLVERDYRSAVTSLQSKCQDDLDQFFELVGQEEIEEISDNEVLERKHSSGNLSARGGAVKPSKVAARKKEMTRLILSGVLKALLNHADAVVSATLQGTIETDGNGEPVIDALTQRPRMRERSGIMVRVDENSNSPGPLHWMLPFKFNNSGQLTLRKLLFNERKLLRGSNQGLGWHAKVKRRQQGFLKSIAMASNCCDRQVDEDSGRPEVAWGRKLIEEIGLHYEDGTPTINCSNAVNLRIYRLCTEDYEVPMSPNAPPHLYDVEVLKLLKALQFEIAAAWASMWRGMLQELTDRDKVREFVQSRLESEDSSDYGGVRLEGFMDRQNSSSFGRFFSPDGRQRFGDRDPALEAVDAVCNWLSGSRALPMDMLTTEEEVKRAGEESKWPDHQAFIDILNQVDAQKVKTAFMANKNTKLAGQPSWLRLCDEFVFVILQLNMKRVTNEELSMAKASAGMMSAAGQQEMIAKLALHRMSQLNMHSQKVFMKRFNFLWARDVSTALTAIEGVAQSLKNSTKNGMNGSEWLEEQMHSYKDKVIQGTLRALQEKFDGLFPVDFAILNGRFPLNAQKLRRQHFELQADGKSVRQRDAMAEIRDMWDTPRYSKMQSVVVSAPDAKSASGPGTIQLSVNGTINAYENLQEQRERVEQIFNLPCVDPPQPDYAGGAFQELCLKFFKGIHVDAIHFCRPRLKAMMAKLYQEEHLRRALQESPALDYLKDFGGHILEKQKNRVDSLRCKLMAMEQTMRETDRNRANSDW
ncbi:unnamed protein product [Effrenium voratum]|uniref:Dynamin N-terminal domain-containing protein n=1 Tax=Effrenium voratum TaxID=2562239 RepID=A0AA36J626_9DINO|nr:unnamed protein product [Effrenium voratum]CAJ1399777.1 unnamed protein product [Effrenium voratum]CAJ1455942.1 unnamed protein product [Effrenium voratum]|mmetsp:Transcript_78335/g.187802  ORF Transcript_78335/g.187802 Transcript_78335/m.187802 type:complete len:1309 (+) Transcript_78335:93-4019(+)